MRKGIEIRNKLSKQPGAKHFRTNEFMKQCSSCFFGPSIDYMTIRTTSLKYE